MNFKKSVFSVVAGLILGAVSVAAQAVVVNLDATVEGFSVTQTFAAGTYNVNWIGVAGGGAYDAWGASVNASAPTGHVKYRDAFAVSFNGGATQSLGNFGPYPIDTASSALSFAQAHPASFTFTAPTTVVFTIPDNKGQFGDNIGGVSLSITQAVPEPQTYALMLAGLGAMAWVSRRRGVGARPAR